MDEDFWQQRWRDDATPFHQDRVNPYLKTHLSRLAAEPGDCLFLPLCGKSVDMRWLHEAGFDVLGIELSPIALRAFFEESKLEYSIEMQGSFEVLRHGSIRLMCGDFFQLEPPHTSCVRAVFDRASLIALPPSMRSRYVDHMRCILPGGAPILLVTLAYPQHEMEGPPFSVDDQEVRALYAETRQLEILEENEILDEMPRFKEKGLTQLTERVYLLT